MHKKALLALLLAMTMMLSGCALIVKDEQVDRATVIVSAGDYAYTKGEIMDMVQSQLMYNQQLYSMYGMAYDVTDPEIIAESRTAVVEYYTEIAAKNIQAVKMGLDQFTEEEEAAIKEAADANWQSLREQVIELYFAETALEGDELEAAIDAQMTELGLRYEEYDLYAREEKMHEKLQAETVKDVTVTDEELQALLDTEVLAAQENYRADPTAYGLSRMYGETVYYHPAGYRLAKQILVQYLEVDQAIINDLEAKISTASSTVESLTNQIAALGADPFALAEQVTVAVAEPAGVASGTDLIVAQEAEITSVETAFGEDVTEEIAELMKQLATAQAEVDFYTAQLANAEANGLAHIDAKTDEILALVNAEGADFEALMYQYTEDPGMQEGAISAAEGYAVCAEMSGTVMDASFIDAVMALENIGDVTGKVPGMYGYYIIQYAGDVQEGIVPMDEVRGVLSESALTTKQDEVFQAALAQWIEAADVKVDLKSLEN